MLIRAARILMLLMTAALAAASRSSAAEASARAPVPDSAAVAEAVRLIQQVFAREYDGLSNNPAPLIKKLLEVAEKTEDPARKYAALIEAEEAAVSGDLRDQAFDLVDRRAAEFDCDGLSRRLELLNQWIPSKSKANSYTLESVYEMAQATASKALESQQFDAGESAARIALGIAGQMNAIAKGKKDGTTMSDADERQRNSQALMSVIKRMSELHADYVIASKGLEGDPDNPALNGSVGQYLCLAVWDWKKGLPFLARGDVPRLSGLAADELKAWAGDASSRKAAFGLANAWWQAAESEDDVGQALLIKAHAGQLYEAVIKDIFDPLDKELTLQRIASTQLVSKELLKRPAIQSEPATEWLRERPRAGPPAGDPQGIKAIDELATPSPAKRTVLSTAVKGGSGGQKFTDEEPPEGAVLIGFYVFTTSSWVDAIQAVYRLPNGALHLGGKHGGNSGKRKTFKFNAGERLTRISGSFSENIVSLQFHTDKRVSDSFGGEGAGAEEFDLMIPERGAFVGFVGRSDFSVNALGLRYVRDE